MGTYVAPTSTPARITTNVKSVFDWNKVWQGCLISALLVTLVEVISGLLSKKLTVGVTLSPAFFVSLLVLGGYLMWNYWGIMPPTAFSGWWLGVIIGWVDQIQSWLAFGFGNGVKKLDPGIKRYGRYSLIPKSILAFISQLVSFSLLTVFAVFFCYLFIVSGDMSLTIVTSSLGLSGGNLFSALFKKMLTLAKGQQVEEELTHG